MLTKQGYIAIVGKPNVGKSTLINTLLNQKLSIISYKPQTTRNKIMGIFKDHDSHIILIDTPGFHNARNKLDLFLNSEVKKSLKLADGVLLLLDPTRKLDDEDLEIIKQLKVWNVENILILITKSDIATNEQQKIVEEFIKNNFENQKFLNISCADENSISTLMLESKNFLESHEEIIFPDASQLELSDEFIINEIIRETIIKLFKQEIPYSVAVFTNKVEYVKEQKLLRIQADIVVEKESQKPILIGKKGLMIKEIGTVSRQKLLDVFDSKIFLELNVKVKKNWRDNNSYIIDLGYKK